MHDEPAGRANAQLEREAKAAMEVAVENIAPAFAWMIDDPLMRATMAQELREADELRERAVAARDDPDHPDHGNWGLQMRARSAQEAQAAARQGLRSHAPTPIMRNAGRPRQAYSGTRRPGTRRVARRANAPPSDDGPGEPEPGEPAGRIIDDRDCT
jgi:hypothetical protein